MFTYRCFVLDRAGHIAERLSIECDHDGATIVRAGAILERRAGMIAIEVWDGARLVQKLNRTPATAEPPKARKTSSL
jgi:hypothetical protein